MGLPVGEAASARVLSKSGQQPEARGQRGRLPRSGSARVGKGEQAVSEDVREEGCGGWWGAELLGSYSAGGPHHPEPLPGSPSPPLHSDAKGSLVGGRWPVGPGPQGADQDASLC